MMTSATVRRSKLNSYGSARTTAMARVAPRRSGRRIGEIVPPAAEIGDVACFQRSMSFADEALDLFTILELHGADGERRRDGGDEAAEMAGRQLPDLDLDRCPFPVADDAGPRRWPARQGIHPICRRGAAGAEEPRAALGELPVER